MVGASIGDIDDDLNTNALNSALSASGAQPSVLKAAIDSNVSIATLYSLKFRKKTNLAYQGGVGVSYKMDDDITLDLSYNLSAVTQHKIGSGDPEVRINMVRVDFDSTGSPTKDINYGGAEAGGVFKMALKHTVMAGIRMSF